MKKNDIFETEIIDMTTEGSGVCRVDNMAVFVPHTAVGDRIRVRIVKVLKSYGFDSKQIVDMVCVREKYQGQGYMRQVMDIAFAEGNRLHVPVILETDAQSKCDKYVHLGMQLAGKRSLGAYGALYDLVKEPE